MLDDFLVRATLAGVGVGLAAAPLGCFVVWRRMAYFGDATAHAAILGVAISLVTSGPLLLGTLGTAVIMALAITALAKRGLSTDTSLGVLSHTALAAGLVTVSLAGISSLDLNAYLFGDVLAASRADLAIIWGGGALVVAMLVWRWSRLLTATLDPDLAAASGINADLEEQILTLALAIVVAVAIKVVGALLIAAMLLIPPAAARPFARTPEGMAIVAAIIGAGAAIAGVWGSLELNTPTGPSIVTAAALVFLVSRLARLFAQDGQA